MSDTVIGRVKAFLKRQARAVRMARAGNVAMIFALSVIPIMVAGGAGIDLARALAVRARMYEAVDAAALAVATKPGLTQEQATLMAQQYFDANFNMNSSYGTPAPLTVLVDPANQQVDVSSNIQMPTTIMGVVGFQNVNLTAASKVVWGQTKIWVGLALDNTGSMCAPAGSSCGTNPASNTKLYALKTATKSLLTMFEEASPTVGDVQVSLIPFNRDVNVGASNATWVDWTEWDQSHGGQCYVNGSGTANSNYTTEAACNDAGTCAINGGATNHSTQTSCNNASAASCSVNPTVNNTQTKCNNAGTCSLTSYTSQSNCQGAGTCSLSGYTTQTNCLNAGTCSISGYTSRNNCEAAFSGQCNMSGYTTQTNCQNAGTCSISGYTTRTNCQNAYNGYVCRINGVSYTDANHDTAAECTATANGVCTKTPASTYNTRTKCRANPNPGTWNTGTWTGINGQGVWTSGVWTTTYGVWTATPGTWTWGTWTSANASWVTHYGVWTPAVSTSFTPNRSGWTGCITDRGTVAGPASSTTNSGYDLVNTTPGTAAESRFPAENYSDCPAQMLGLGYNWTALDSKVDAMVGRGNTNQTIGLAWAWQSLTQGNPMSPPALPEGTTRHIILLSDGENTENRWYPSGQSSTRQNIDNRMHLLCNNAKNDDVIIWTVFVNVSGTAGSPASMKDCATGGEFGGHYIEVTTASGIGTAFNAIGQQITNLRVAH